MTKLAPLLNDVSTYSVLDQFIEKSRKLHIPFSQRDTPHDNDDCTLRAPKWHEVLFDSPNVRILWGVTEPGEREPSHQHKWQSLMLVIQGSLFYIENADGSTEEGEWPMGVYELPTEKDSSAYTNIGSSTFKALRFEIKEVH